MLGPLAHPSCRFFVILTLCRVLTVCPLSLTLFRLNLDRFILFCLTKVWELDYLFNHNALIHNRTPLPDHWSVIKYELDIIVINYQLIINYWLELNSFKPRKTTIFSHYKSDIEVHMKLLYSYTTTYPLLLFFP